MIVVIDTETTGLVAGHHDLIEICALALTEGLDINKNILPFHMMLKPKHPERADPQALAINKQELAKLEREGMDPFKAADMFVEWCQKLDCNKIQPLGHNYGTFDRGFILEWLGKETFELLIDYHYRDTCPVANYWIDRHKYHNGQVPMFKHGISLRKCANYLGVEVKSTHNALSDCLLTAEVYRRMMNLIVV